MLILTVNQNWNKVYDGHLLSIQCQYCNATSPRKIKSFELVVEHNNKITQPNNT